jgi:NADH-quinone oxidoreductase chain G
MISIKINNLEFLVKSNVSILEACKLLGYTIPRFCYHESLSISGNCRMCLVEVEGSEKPVASCVTDIEDGMSIWLNTIFVKKARENVLEILLINHPLDCPICDQAGECDLQDQTKIFGGDYSRMFKIKTSVEDKNCGPLIKTIMTRCIHCTRCIRFGDEVAGLSFLGTLNRGGSTEIGSYMSKIFESEISGNVIDLCPVGALTSKPYAFKSRPWELRLSENIDVTDGVGSNIYINFKQVDILRITPKNNMYINENFISDKARFSFDFLKNNRILSLFEKKQSNFFSLDWISFLKKIKSDKKTVLVNSELGFLSLNILKNLSYLLGNQFKLITDFYVNHKNFYYQNCYDFLSNIEDTDKNCYIFSSNTKLEACLLNLRLRLKRKKSLLNISSLGMFYDNDVISNFVFLDFSKSLCLIEGKYNACSSVSTDKIPLFILGSNLNTQIFDDFVITKHLKTYFNNCNIVKINRSVNRESIDFLGIKGVAYKKLQNNNSAIAVKLDDTVFTRKIMNTYLNKFIIWINTHGSSLSLHANMIIPTYCTFEEEELYLSLEQRPQYSKKIFKGPEESRGVASILKTFVEINKIDKLGCLFTEFLTELAQNSDLFEKNKNSLFAKKLFLLKNSINGHSCFVVKYPQKSYTEDFYLTSVYTKNSAVMQDCSKKSRKLQTNFSKI